VADVKGLPVRDGVFDAAWIRSVLVHVDDPLGVLREVRRILRPWAGSLPRSRTMGATLRAVCCERVRADPGASGGDVCQPADGAGANGYVREAGFGDVRGRAATVQFERLADAQNAGGPFDLAAADAADGGAITEEEARAYLDAMEPTVKASSSSWRCRL
jgi:SAM-dependent methyltransferase